jgi:thioredoxin reductase
MTTSFPPATCDVAIVGGGPSGLAAATQLKALGIASVVVLEREPQAGGIPRHCGHPPFGMREFKRIMTGPVYAEALIQKARMAGVEIFPNTTVVKIHEDGRLTLSTEKGIVEIKAKRVILSTGVRETPRAPRFITGQRPLGISTTGALQSMVYLKNTIPFKRPIIIGTELVSFSSLLTCCKAGIKPVAIIESDDRITARSICRLLPIIFGVPLRLNTSLVEILGKTRVTGVRIKTPTDGVQEIDCDGVLFTGQFTPESSLMRMGNLDIDHASGGPIIDQYGQCSAPNYSATGNLLHPVETAGWCWNEGVGTAFNVAKSLMNKAQQGSRLNVVLKSSKLKYVTPQTITRSHFDTGVKHFQLRFLEAARGKLSLRHNDQTLWFSNNNFLPERRVLIPLPDFTNSDEPVEIHFMEEP